MTVRELRQVLFDLDRQGLTVAELRGLLFDFDEQDAELTAGVIFLISISTEEKQAK